MNGKLVPNILLILGLVAPAAALANSLTVVTQSVRNPSLVQRLEEQARQNDINAKFWSQEPIVQQDYYVQTKECRDLIAKLSAGEVVSKGELAQALKPIDLP